MGEPASIGDYDYIIVGAGSAGCLLANRLSADASVSVLLLEAGGKDDHIWLKVPVGARYTQGTPRFDWCFKSEPEPGLNGRRINVPRGRVLGGGEVQDLVREALDAAFPERDEAHRQLQGADVADQVHHVPDMIEVFLYLTALRAVAHGGLQGNRDIGLDHQAADFLLR